MADNRLHVRLDPIYHDWLASIGSSESDTARALLVLGAAALGLGGVEREAMRLANANLSFDVLMALREVSDRCRTNVGQVSDIPTLESEGLAEETRDDPLANDDPLASVGFDV